MKITWLGHSCFLFQNSTGKRILTDPFDITIGYTPYTGDVEVITISHNHFDHSYIDENIKSIFIIDTPGKHQLDFGYATGFTSFHDNVNGLKRGPNIIFLFELEGLRICHLGDLGHNLNDDTLKHLKNLDLLLIPVGGHYTLDGIRAASLAKKINARYIIPMHYKTDKLSFLLDGPDKFITAMKNVVNLKDSSFLLSKEEQCLNKVILLSPL